jgi:ribosome biogenesis GTPase
VIAANIDILVIVCGLDQDFNLRRIERYLAASADSGSSCVIVLNKADLCSDVAPRIAEVQQLKSSTPIVALSALDEHTGEALLPYLPSGKTAALVGSSGAGKSTIINQLLGSSSQLAWWWPGARQSRYPRASAVGRRCIAGRSISRDRSVG